MFNDIVDGCDKDEIDKHGGSYTYIKSGNPNKALVAEMIPIGSIRKGETQCADMNGHYSTPRDDDNSGGPTVNAAIGQWCSDNAGSRVDWLVYKDVSWRFPINNLKVPDRSSFFLHANLNHDRCYGKTKQEIFNKNQCIQALHDGMDRCDDKKTRTHGHTTAVGCIDYSIVLSGITRDGSTPWEASPKFPPPEFEADLGGVDTTPSCANGQAGRPISDSDLDKAIDGFCKDGAEIKGYGKYGEYMNDFPPEGQPQFYNDDLYKMHLTMGAETVENGGPVPYKNMGWCK
ncbi:hypothetical protein SBOR_7500 [Sclerotinia borealis F-4128]|uniref:Uncharacterized protein n=1 Tax=Sclerotinia borealis (strain F-4128) TaxID=1432307 RepID=W9C8D3_SCLBF|nr:hypothetical protein SBOR_7500 [Sclerotinia borealis F-4128]